MSRVFPATLTRRTVIAVLLAFLLVFLALMTYQYAQLRRSEAQKENLVQAARQMVDALGAAETSADARRIAGAVERMSSGERRRLRVPGSLLWQVLDRRAGLVVFSSDALGGGNLLADPVRFLPQQSHGGTFEVAGLDTQRWSIRIAQSRLETAWILKSLSRELIEYLLVALPFVLVPVWLAVAGGLRPLRNLTKRIAARGADDLSPTGIEPHYAELKPIVAALDSLLAKLTNKIARERGFVQDAAHELRTPLAVISAQAYALARSHNAVERADAARYLEAAVTRASHQIHQLLALAQLDVSRPEAISSVDLAQLVRQDLAGFSAVATARSIELTMQGPDRLDLTVDPILFQSVLHNLVDNAIRYGREVGRVVVELAAWSSGWQLNVSDDGPGIPLQERALVFDRFYRGAGRDRPGTGLGLAIVSQAVRQLGGDVSLADGLDSRGCRFTVTVPAQRRTLSA